MKIILKKCNQNDYATQKELKYFCIISLVLIFTDLKSGITLFLIFLLEIQKKYYSAIYTCLYNGRKTRNKRYLVF